MFPPQSEECLSVVSTLPWKHMVWFSCFGCIRGELKEKSYDHKRHNIWPNMWVSASSFCCVFHLFIRWNLSEKMEYYLTHFSFCSFLLKPLNRTVHDKYTVYVLPSWVAWLAPWFYHVWSGTVICTLSFTHHTCFCFKLHFTFYEIYPNQKLKWYIFIWCRTSYIKLTFNYLLLLQLATFQIKTFNVNFYMKSSPV